MKRILLTITCLMFGFSAAAAGPVHIAFVDTGNTGRSVTAEALAMAMAVSYTHLTLPTKRIV